MEAQNSMDRAGRWQPYTAGGSYPPAVGFYLTDAVTMQGTKCRIGPSHVASFLLANMPVVSSLCKGVVRSHDKTGLFFPLCYCLKSSEEAVLSPRCTLVQKFEF